jgi:hypothetical protein
MISEEQVDLTQYWSHNLCWVNVTHDARGMAAGCKPANFGSNHQMVGLAKDVEGGGVKNGSVLLVVRSGGRQRNSAAASMSCLNFLCKERISPFIAGVWTVIAMSERLSVSPRCDVATWTKTQKESMHPSKSSTEKACHFIILIALLLQNSISCSKSRTSSMQEHFAFPRLHC